MVRRRGWKECSCCTRLRRGVGSKDISRGVLGAALQRGATRLRASSHGRPRRSKTAIKHVRLGLAVGPVLGAVEAQFGFYCSTVARSLGFSGARCCSVVVSAWSCGPIKPQRPAACPGNRAAEHCPARPVSGTACAFGPPRWRGPRPWPWRCRFGCGPYRATNKRWLARR